MSTLHLEPCPCKQVRSVYCRSAINLIFFHDIKISIGLEKDVTKVIHSLQRKLENADSFGLVRQLILTTERDWSVPNAECEPPTFWSLRRVGLVNTYTTQYAHLREMTLDRANKFSLGMIPDPVWKPVADLIPRLPRRTYLRLGARRDIPTYLAGQRWTVGAEAETQRGKKSALQEARRAREGK